MKQICVLLFINLALCNATAQQKESINWKTWQELEQAIQKEPKPVFIFFHAEWCSYCKKIQREIFTKPTVISKINSTYYALEMDVERTDTITFEGVEFTNKEALHKRNGVHEIPLLLASRKDKPLSLPTTVILNKDFTLRERIFEYYTAKKLLDFL